MSFYSRLISVCLVKQSNKVIYCLLQYIPNGCQLNAQLLCFDSRLGHKIQGMLCDGNSNEVVASTVVNCLKIDEGKRQKYSHYSLFCVF